MLQRREGVARWIRVAWVAAVAAAIATRAVNIFSQSGPAGYDAWGHISYVLFLDRYRSVPLADQGWSYFHPPLHYLLGWVLAQFGSAEVLASGLAFLGSVASLAVSLLASRVVAMALPGRPLYSLLAFTVVAFWPPQVYVSGMPGNELTATFFGSACVVAFLVNTRRPTPSLAADAGVGALAGLALLSKFSGLIPLLAIIATSCVARMRGEGRTAALVLRFAVILATALVLAGPYYARNISEFGSPFMLSRSYPLILSVEGRQPPGERTPWDFISFPPSLFADPRPKEDPLLHSVWGSVYVRMWSEGVESLTLRRALLIAGVIPSGLALFGFLRSFARVRRTPDACVDTAMLLLSLATLMSFAIFAWRVPIFSALKASYLLNASLPFGFFVARAVAQPPRWLVRPFAAIAIGAVTASSVLAMFGFTPGVGTPRADHSFLMAALRTYFGDYARAGAAYRVRLRDLAEQRPGPIAHWMGIPISHRVALAGVELLRGREERASALFQQAMALPETRTPHIASRGQRLSSAAAATALAGDSEVALGFLEEALGAGPLPEALVNRAALRARRGDFKLAKADLEVALELVPDLLPGWHNLAWVLTRIGNDSGASRARGRAAELGGNAPRGYPYGVGNGLHAAAHRFMLVLEEDRLVLHWPAGPRRNVPAER